MKQMMASLQPSMNNNLGQPNPMFGMGYFGLPMYQFQTLQSPLGKLP